MPHDLAVLAGAGLRLVGIDDEIVRAVADLLRHERPFEAGREARPAAAAQPRFLHLLDDRVAALLQDRLGAVPGAARARALQARIVQAVEVREDAVLVGEHRQPVPLAFAGRKLAGLADPVFALDPAVERQMLVDPRDLRLRPRRDLIEMKHAEIVQALLVDRPDAGDTGQIVRLAAARLGQPRRLRRRSPLPLPPSATIGCAVRRAVRAARRRPRIRSRSATSAR